MCRKNNCGRAKTTRWWELTRLPFSLSRCFDHHGNTAFNGLKKWLHLATVERNPESWWGKWILLIPRNKQTKKTNPRQDSLTSTRTLICKIPKKKNQPSQTSCAFQSGCQKFDFKSVCSYLSCAPPPRPSTDALPAPAEPERALQDLPEHERQHAAHPAPAAALHPDQHQLQQAGPRLPQQPVAATPVQRWRGAADFTGVTVHSLATTKGGKNPTLMFWGVVFLCIYIFISFHFPSSWI